MEHTVLEMCRLSSPQEGRWPDRYLHEYAECRARSGRVVLVARLVLPATLMGYILVFRAELCVMPSGGFWPSWSKPSRSFRIIRVVSVPRYAVASCWLS